MWALIGAIVLGGVLAIPGAHSFAVLRWIPYSSLEFFAVVTPIFMVAGLLKRRVPSVDGWITCLEILNAAYLLLLFPQPVALVFSALWFYAILRWRLRDKRWTYLQGALMLLPLALKHSTHQIQFWGLSYATFRAFHLFMDDRLLPDLKFRRYALFVFFFPALLAGPIDRWPRFREALIKSKSVALSEAWSRAAHLLAFGLLQKFVLGEAVRRYVLPEHTSTAFEWLKAFYGYPLYLYLDFAGYSAMAIGFASLVGVTTPANFDRPFLAVNPQDFWRRFHISLGEWLRDYFFKPIYKASAGWRIKSPLARQNVALFLTFLAMGLWNGPRAQFVLSGALFGAYSVVHNTFVYRRKARGVTAVPGALGLWGARVVMLHLAALALFIFSGAPFRG